MSAKRDISGQRFGMLVVRSFAHIRSGVYYWNCVCDCGGTATIAYRDLSNPNRHRSCGCAKRRSAWEAGAKFGRATVVHRDTQRCNDNGGFLTLRCDCGTVFRLTCQRAREIAQEMSLACRPCRDKEKGEAVVRVIKRSRACRICGGLDHNQRECPRKPKGKYEKYCARCSGLEHRRDKPRCRRCGEPYKPEPPVTAEYIHGIIGGDGQVWPRPVWFADPRQR